jgi:hypothetical protein
MDDRIINNGQATDEATPELGPAAEAEAGAPCADCLSGRSIMLIAAFAAFAAYVAADFMSGGRLTAAVAGLLGAAGKRGEDG